MKKQTAHPGMPEAPPWMQKRSREAWDWLGPQLVAQGKLTEHDGLAFLFLCDAYADYTDAQQHLGERETVIVTKTGYEQPNPWVNIRDHAFGRALNMYKELGLTPLRDTKIPRKGKPTAEDPLEKMLGDV